MAKKKAKRGPGKPRRPQPKAPVRTTRRKRPLRGEIPESKTNGAPTALIELPLGHVAEKEYLSRHVEVRLKTRAQQLAMKRIVRGLQQEGARTADGRPVQRPGEVIRYLLEQISESD